MPHDVTEEAAGAATADPPVGLDWLDRFGDALYGYAVRRVGRGDVAEDLVQETLLAGVRARPSYDGRADEGTWLTGILRNKVADHLRGRYRRGRTDGGSLDAHGQADADEAAAFDRRGRWRSGVASWSGDPHRLAEGAEFRRAVDACLAKLPRRMAHVFRGRVEDDASTADLCAELDISADNAWALLHRARLRLQACLTATWFTAADPRPGAP